MIPHSIEDWFYKYEKDVTSFLIYYTGTLDVEDLVQDTFLIALKSISAFKGESHPKTWLITIARNQVLDTYRRRKLWSRLTHLLHLKEEPSDEVAAWLVRNQEADALYQAIRQLSRKNREVVILRGILEMSSKEVSAIVNLTENAVNVMFHRALKKLRQLLEEEESAHGKNERIT
ncbi:RNA polymerase sigma factor [Sporosarcina sp. 179-K 3D1 HS]|uniref:RNA polymerase sigma factor n=1 Tax=Sporosarcina sp. 179-K 3D1 HS TaxID=3232169 RepID=UPI0039A1E066